MPQDVTPDEEGQQQWYTAEEAARYLRTTRVTIYRWSEQGLLAYHSLPGGRGRRWSRADLDAFLGPSSKQQQGEG